MSGNKSTPTLPLSESLFSTNHIWQVVHKNWPVVLGLTTAVTLVVAFYTLRETKIYRATETILIDPNPPKPLGKEVQTVVEMGTGSYWGNIEYYETQFRILQSRRLAEDVVHTLGLNRDAGFLLNLASGKTAPPMEMSVEAAANTLRARIKVDPIKSSRLVNVSVSDADPIRAQRLVTTLISSYIDQNVDNVVASTRSATDWLSDQLAKLKDELERGELALHGYKTDKGLLSVSFDDQSNMLREEMVKVNGTLAEVKTKLQHVAARREVLHQIDTGDPSNIPMLEFMEDHVLNQLRVKYLDARRMHQELLGQGKGDSHPEVRSVAAAEKVSRDALKQEIEGVQKAVDADYTALTSEAAGLTGLFEVAKKRALELNLQEIEYKRLLRTKNNTEKVYSLVLDRTKESELTGMMKFNNIRVVDSALVPRIPESPRVVSTIALGALAGFLLGLAFAVTRELFDRTLKGPDEVERELGTTFLGLLPIVGSKASTKAHYGQRHRKRAGHNSETDGKGTRELIVHNQPSSGIAEAARAIRTNILFMAPDNPHRTLLVTSAGPAEGKTTVACCIAVAMAQAGQRVLLMDCDLRRPRIHRIFGRSNDVGVTSLILDSSKRDSALYTTDVPNLSILTSGPVPPNPAELLHSEAFTRLLSDVRKDYDRIIIDSSPAVPVTDAIVLSRVVDGTVIVARAFVTTRELGRRAVRALRDVDARIVGSVLNAVDLNRRGYSYYQYYYYNRYYSEGEPNAKKPPPPQDEAQL